MFENRVTFQNRGTGKGDLTQYRNTSKSVSRVFRRNFGETAVHKNIWIEEHNGIKEDLTNRFEWSGQNIMNSIVFLGLIPCFIYIVGKNAQDVGRFVPRLPVETV